MKATGIVRKVDPLGRVVLPKELRRSMGLDECTPIEIYTDGDGIVLKKYDAVGGVEQILDKFMSDIQAQSELLPPAQANALLAKALELSEIIRT